MALAAALSTSCPEQSPAGGAKISQLITFICQSKGVEVAEKATEMSRLVRSNLAHGLNKDGETAEVASSLGGRSGVDSDAAILRESSSYSSCLTSLFEVAERAKELRKKRRRRTTESAFAARARVLSLCVVCFNLG